MSDTDEKLNQVLTLLATSLKPKDKAPSSRAKKAEARETMLASVEKAAEHRTAMSMERKHVLTFWGPALGYHLSSDCLVYNDEFMDSRTLVGLVAEQAGDLYTVQRLQFAVDHLMRDMRSEARAALKAGLCDVPVTGDGPLHEWMRHMEHASTSPERHEANVVALKHFIWSIKQQLLGHARVWEFMPIFYGQGGGGKTTNVRALLAPLRGAWREADFTVFKEKFEGANMARNYAILFDEMNRVEQVGPEALKTWVSKKLVEERGAYAKNQVPERMLCTFVATTNRRPPFGIYDTATSVRRWYGIECSSSHIVRGDERARFFDSVDIDALWSAVDAYGPAPLLKNGTIHPYISAWQLEHMRSRHDIEAMLEAQYSNILEPLEVNTAELCFAYGEFLAGRYPAGKIPVKPTVPEFVKQLTELGISTSKTGNRPVTTIMPIYRNA
jgi:hypothetical protein